jgi:hypothetical protein
MEKCDLAQANENKGNWKGIDFLVGGMVECWTGTHM